MAMDGANGDLAVTTTAEDVVVALVPMEEHHLALSNLDLLLPRLEPTMFFCYKNNINNTGTFKEKVCALKQALARALAYFYPLAGKFVENSAGAPELLCNNRGVQFTEAFADVQLCELNLYNPDQSAAGKLVPTINKGGLLAIQVTELKCGAMVISCTVDHQVTDAYSQNMLLVLWAEIASSKPISFSPNFERSLLNHRDQLKYDPSVEDMYIHISSMAVRPREDDKNAQTWDPMVSRTYYISAEQISHLQSLASDGATNGYSKRTKLQSFCAFLWKMVASHACQSGTQNQEKIGKMGIVVDGRTRLSEGESEEKRTALASYYGNVISVPFGQQKCGDLSEKPLSWVADKVQNFLEPAVQKEHFLDIIDWVEAHGRQHAIAQAFWAKDEDEPVFVVSSGLQSPVSGLDFGWGKPAFGSVHFPWVGKTGYVMPMPNPSKNGGWIVYMYFHQNWLNFIEVKAPHVFQPFLLLSDKECFFHRVSKL